MDKSEPQENPSAAPIKFKLWMIVLLFLAVLALWLATPIAMQFVGKDLAARGQAGDLYGSINALFSGLAFAGVIVAILLQREELMLQRQELAATRAELARSAIAQEASQEALNKTIYAQTFRVALEILEGIDVIYARRIVVEKLSGIYPSTWSEEDRAQAEVVARTFDSVGTMVKRELLPLDYIIETWSVPIVRHWKILGDYVKELRKSRSDPYLGIYFEYLAREADEFLETRAMLDSLNRM